MNGRAAAAVMLAACGTGIDAEPVAPPGLVELTVADPQSLGIYEYTLRMTDGSSRVSRETLPRAGAWENG